MKDWEKERTKSSREADTDLHQSEFVALANSLLPLSTVHQKNTRGSENKAVNKWK